MNIIFLGATCQAIESDEATIRLDLDYSLSNVCNTQDSADLIVTNIWGGTPPHSLLWVATGEISSNVMLSRENILPSSEYIIYRKLYYRH